MRTRRREIAKAGIFGSRDNPQIVTGRDLREIAETFAGIKKAPVVFGHYPRAEDPRPGNVVSVSYDEAAETLSAEIEEEDVLADAVDAGYYPDVSISAKQRAADGKMYLVHLAYLGQEAPAVKDLKSSIKETLGIAAAETPGARTFPSPRDERIASGALFYDDLTAGGTITASKIESSTLSTNTIQRKEVQMDEKEAQKLREENERLKAEGRAKDLALSEAADRRREAARERLKAAMDGKVPRGLQGKVLELSGAFDEEKGIELSDESAPGGKRKTTGMELLLEIVSALPRPVEPGTLSLGDPGSAANTSGKPDAAARRKLLSAV
jgi:hypothetical protein